MWFSIIIIPRYRPICTGVLLIIQRPALLSMIVNWRVVQIVASPSVIAPQGTAGECLELVHTLGRKQTQIKTFYKTSSLILALSTESYGVAYIHTYIHIYCEFNKRLGGRQTASFLFPYVLFFFFVIVGK